MVGIGKVIESPSREVSPMATKRDAGHEPGRGDAAGRRPSITIPLAIRPAASKTGDSSEDKAFEQNVAFYEEQLPSWREHQGQHVLIHGGDLCDFFATHMEALTAGFDRFGRQPFLVKQVDLDARPRPLAGVIL
jgi:hypothetical protein